MKASIAGLLFVSALPFQAAGAVNWDASSGLIFDPVVFQWQFYLDANPDLKSAGMVTEDQAKSHWQSNGISECRRASPEFSSRDYLSLNPDVAAGLPTPEDCNGALTHYLTNGRLENRQKTKPFYYGSDFGFGDNWFGNQKLTVRTDKKYAGAVSEIWFRGVQFVNNHDTGRLFQTAFAYDNLGECYNPTEGGMSEQAPNPERSKLLSNVLSAGSLKTVAQPAYWQAPGQQCAVGVALGSANLADASIEKNIKIGFEGDDQIISWNTQLAIPAGHSYLRAEMLTGYHNAEFDHYFSYSTFDRQLTPMSILDYNIANPDWSKYFHRFMPVFSTGDGNHALGVFPVDVENQSPDNLLRVAKFGAFSSLGKTEPGDSTTKWSVTYDYENPDAGTYSSTVYLVFGNLAEVREKLSKLQDRFAHQLTSLLATNNGEFAYTASSYLSLNPDLSVIGDDRENLFNHFVERGLVEKRKSTEEFNGAAYIERYPDLRNAFGPNNYLAGLKHYIEVGRAEGRNASSQ